MEIYFQPSQYQKNFFSRTVSFYCKIMIWCLNIRVNALNVPSNDQHYLFVGNHLGFLDILILSSVRSCLFITSVEMKETPFLGTLCEMGGCLFVERRSRSQIGLEIESIRAALKDGFNIVLYPEGTAHNGEKVLPFKKSLLTAAAGTGVPILPLVLNFTQINGEPMSAKWRNHVFWYGDLNFIATMWRTMSLRRIDVSLEFLDPIHIHSDEERSHVAEKAHSMIQGKFKNIV